jgi:hypothetical protein
MKIITEKFNNEDIKDNNNKNIMYVYVVAGKMKEDGRNNANFLKDLKMNNDTDNNKKVKDLFERAKKRINNTSLPKIEKILIYPGIFGQIKEKCGPNVGKYFSEELDKFKKNHGGGNTGHNGNRTARRNGNRTARRNGNRTARRNGGINGNRTSRRNGNRTARRNGNRTSRNNGNNIINKFEKELRRGASAGKVKNNSSVTLEINNNNKDSNSYNSNIPTTNSSATKKKTKREREREREKAKAKGKGKVNKNEKPTKKKGLLKFMRQKIEDTELLCNECKRNELLLNTELLSKNYSIARKYINRLKKSEKYCNKCLKLCKFIKKNTESKKLRKDQDIFRARLPKVCKPNIYGNIKALEIKKGLRERLIKQYEKINK